MMKSKQTRGVVSATFKVIKSIILFFIVIVILAVVVIEYRLHRYSNSNIGRFQEVHENIKLYPKSDYIRKEENGITYNVHAYLKKFYEIDPNTPNGSLQSYFRNQLTEDGWSDIRDVSEYICGLKAKKNDYNLVLLCERKYWYDDETTIKISEYGFLTSISGEDRMYYYNHASNEDLERMLNLIRYGNPYGGAFSYSIEINDDPYYK